MNRVLAELTARQLLGRRRTIVVAAVVLLLPVLLGLAFRLFANSSGPSEEAEFAIQLTTGLTLGLLVPIMALVLGTAAIGSDIEDGTAVFLLSKPIERWKIMAVKTVVSALVAVALVTPGAVVSTWLVMGSPSEFGLVLGVGLIVLAGATIYTAVFVALSAVTHRAIIIGLVYVFLWELSATNLFPGLRWASVREYSEGWGEVFISSPDSTLYDPHFGLTASIIGSVVVIGILVVAGTRALVRYQIGERG